jgi:hypothetical protein
MKHLFTLVSLWLLTTAAHAQTWCPPGAKWTYSYAWFFVHGDVTLRYSGDTVLAGQACKVLRKELLVKDGLNPNAPPLRDTYPSEYTYSDANRVYIYGNGQFYTLYNFAAQPGDSWALAPSALTGWCTQPGRIVVDSVGQQVVQGVMRRWFRAHPEFITAPAWGQLFGFRGRIYEGIGPVGGYMLLQASTSQCGGTDPETGGDLLCYSATGIPTFYPGSNQSCSTILASAERRAVQLGFSVYPNPSNGQLALRLPSDLSQSTVEIHDLAGRCVQQQPLPASHQLDVRHLPAGFYSIAVRQNGRTLATSRFVRQ